MTSREIIETSAREVSAELVRRGIDPDERVVIAIARESEAGRGKRQVRVVALPGHGAGTPLTVAELQDLAEEGRQSGLSDEDGEAFLDRLEAKYRALVDRE